MKVLILGYGSIGKRHIEVLESISNDFEIHIVSKQDISDYRVFRSLGDVEDLQIYDYFIIATITILHQEQLKYINYRVEKKKILVEKPIGISPFDIEERNDIFVAYNLRFHKVFQDLKSFLSDSRILSIHIHTGQYLPDWRPGRDYSTTYSADIDQGGGVLLDLSHELDYMIWLAGNVESCYSINRKISELKISSDDYCTVIGKTEKNVFFNLSVDYLLRKPKRVIVVNADNKTIYADLISNKLEVYGPNGFKDIKKYCLNRNYTYQKMHESILFNSSEDVASYSDGIKVMDFVEMIRRNNND